jgi:hypothetical protein
MKLEFSQQIFKKYRNIKFQECLSGGSRDVPYGQTDRQTDMKKLTVAVHTSANTSEKVKVQFTL